MSKSGSIANGNDVKETCSLDKMTTLNSAESDSSTSKATIGEKVDDGDKSEKSDKIPAFCMSSIPFNLDYFEQALGDLEEFLNPDVSSPVEEKDVTNPNMEARMEALGVMKEDYTEEEASVLRDIFSATMEPLPTEWHRDKHDTGFWVYYHLPTNVCTLSRPYVVSSENIYNHRIPLSAIPCLEYRRGLEEISKFSGENKTRVIGHLKVPIVKIETVEENQLRKTVDAKGVREYCQKLFKFQEVSRESNELEVIPKRELSNLPDEVKVAWCSLFEKDENGEVCKRREVCLVLRGRTFSNILQNVCHQMLKASIAYEYKPRGHRQEAVLKLDGVVFCEAIGDSKDKAKHEVSKKALEMLIPELNGKAEEVCVLEENPTAPVPSKKKIMKELDSLSITDPRVFDLSKVGRPELTPFAILTECLRRNGLDSNFEVSFETSDDFKSTRNYKFSLKAGLRIVPVICRNKKQGKQLASQQLLQDLHPDLKTWGDVVKIYNPKYRETKISPCYILHAEVWNELVGNKKDDLKAKNKPQPRNQAVKPENVTKNFSNERGRQTNRPEPARTPRMAPSNPAKNASNETARHMVQNKPTRSVAPKMAQPRPTAPNFSNRSSEVSPSQFKNKQPQFKKQPPSVREANSIQTRVKPSDKVNEFLFSKLEKELSVLRADAMRQNQPQVTGTVNKKLFNNLEKELASLRNDALLDRLAPVRATTSASHQRFMSSTTAESTSFSDIGTRRGEKHKFDSVSEPFDVPPPPKISRQEIKQWQSQTSNSTSSTNFADKRISWKSDSNNSNRYQFDEPVSQKWQKDDRQNDYQWSSQMYSHGEDYYGASSGGVAQSPSTSFQSHDTAVSTPPPWVRRNQQR